MLLNSSLKAPCDSYIQNIFPLIAHNVDIILCTMHAFLVRGDFSTLRSGRIARNDSVLLINHVTFFQLDRKKAIFFYFFFVVREALVFRSQFRFRGQERIDFRN